MSSLVPSTVVLGLVALASLSLALRRHSPTDFTTERATAARALALATLIQAAHFAEEWFTGFHIRFPALFELPPMPVSLFVSFNLTWIAIWVASVPPLHRANQAAFFAAWFLSIAGMLNGLAHPVLAVGSGGYFPGLISSPFIGLVSVYLWRNLHDATTKST